MARRAKTFTEPKVSWRGSSAELYWRFDNIKNRVSLGPCSKKQAEEIRLAKLAALEKDARALVVERETGVKVRTHAPLLRDFVETDYLPSIEAGKRKPTARHALTPILDRFGNMQIDRIPPVEVERYKTERMKKVKTATLNKEIRMFKAALRRAVDLGYIEKITIEGVKAPKVRSSAAVKFFSKEEMQRIYAAAGEDEPLWRFLANTGLRRAEMVKARRSDIVTTAHGPIIQVESIEGDEDESEQFEGTTKSGKVRNVPLNRAALASLEQLGEDQLTSVTTVSGLDKRWERTRDVAHVSGGVHRLRHTYASNHVMNGTPLRALQALLGHSRIETTMIYAHLADEFMGGVAANIDL